MSLRLKNLRNRFKQEAAAFNEITVERARNHQIPDIRAEFFNPYFYNNVWRNSKFVKDEFGTVCTYIVNCLRNAKVRSVVEIGSGNGYLSLELARKGFRVTGVDISKESINFAQKYFKSLKKEYNKLNLHYLCRNVSDDFEYKGESIVCFGSLHHLPPVILKKVIARISSKMKPGQVLVAVEPRYDHASLSMAILVYALRLSLPNHFQYKEPLKNIIKNVDDIYLDLADKKEIQSEMNNESSSKVILETIQQYYEDVEITGCTSFFDKIIGSIRVSDKDSVTLSKTLKTLDKMIVKYNPDFCRNLNIFARK